MFGKNSVLRIMRNIMWNNVFDTISEQVSSDVNSKVEDEVMLPGWDDNSHPLLLEQLQERLNDRTDSN